VIKGKTGMKIKIVWIAVFLVGVASSCETKKMPQGVLTKPELADYLVEMYVAEARMTGLSVMPDSSRKLFQPFEEALMKKRGISDSVMRITYRYYVNNPNELEEVYDVVIDTLSLREQKEGLKSK
jgi:Domain of unknown function (DUF4296)